MGSDRTGFNNTALLNIRNVFKKRHTLATALQWRSLLDANPHLGTEDIANQVGLTRDSGTTNPTPEQARSNNSESGFGNASPHIEKEIFAQGST
jgi:hypothetical protein